MAGTPLAEAFVRVRALTDKFKDDIRDGLRGVGADFGKQFSREVSTSLRGERGTFEDEGRALGEQAGDAAGDAFGEHMAEQGAVKFGDDGAPFVRTGRRLGGESGDAAGREFADRMEEGAVRFGDDGNRFVDVGKKTGKDSGEAAGDSYREGFNRRAREGARDHGRRAGRDFGDGANDGLRDALKGLTPAFGDVASAIGKVLGTGSLWGAVSAGVAALGAAAASSAGYVVALAGEIAPLAGLLAGLPGVALVGAAAFTSWKLATGGLGEAMKQALAGNDKALAAALDKLSAGGREFVAEFQAAIPALRDFKAAAQDAFTGQLAGSLAGFVSALDGLKPAISGLATEFGAIVRQVLAFVTSAQSIASFNTVLGNTRALVAAVRGALDPLLRGFVDLGEVGSAWLGGFSGSLQRVLTTFGKWMSEIAASGQAFDWLQDATVVLQALGGIAKDVWGIFTGLLKAGRDAGTGALGVLGQLVDKFNEWVNSTEGHDVLVTVFRALDEVGRALVPVLSALGGAVAKIAPEASKVATALGPVLASAIRVLGDGIAALGPGLVRTVQGFGRMVDSIGPLEPLGQAVGDVFAALGGALALVVPEIAKIAVEAAPALSNALRALGPALAALGPGLTAIAQQLAKAFADPAFVAGLLAIGKGISDLLIAAAPLLPVVAQLAGILGQVLGGALSNLGAVLGPVVNALASALQPALQAISDALLQLTPLMPPIYESFGRIAAAVLTEVLPPVLNLIPSLLNGLVPAFVELWRATEPMIPLLTDLAVQLIQQVLPAILPILPQLAQLSLEFTRLGLVVAQLVADLAPIIERGIAIFQHLYDVLVGHSIIPDLITAMRDWFQRGVDWVRGIISWFGDLPGLMSSWLNSVLSTVQQHWDGIRSAISDRVGQARDTISRALDDIGNRWSQGWDNVRNVVSTAWNSIRSAVSNGVNNVISVVSSLPGHIVGALGNIGYLLYGSGQSLFQGFINGMYSMLQGAYNAAADILGRIRSLFPFSPAREGPFSGKGWTLYSGRSLITGLAEGVRQQEGELTSAMDQVMRAGAAALAPALPALAGPSPAPAFDGTFAAPASASSSPASASGGITIENINIQGVLDPSNPVSYRRMVEQLREAIRQLEREVYG